MGRYRLYRAAFEALSLPGIARAIRRFSRAKGVILTLHRVLPEPPAAFAPNSILQVTPDFLETVIVTARAAGFDIVDLDEAVRRMAGTNEKPFVVLTFDDAYRDNLQYALPILRKHAAPFTLYVPTALVDGVGMVWWQALEDVIASRDVIAAELPEGLLYIDTAILEQKHAAFANLYDRYRKMPESDREEAMRALARRHGMDLEAHCRSLIMDWTELKTFADESLCAIGAHTVHHYELSKLPEEQMREEIEQSLKVLRAQFGTAPRHFSYPIGSFIAAGEREFSAVKKLGFSTAVTTRPGGIYAEHVSHLECLPRISLNGKFQQKRFVEVFLTAEIFRLMRRGRRLDIS